MISCSTERPSGKAYPFDVRGRKIVDYTTGKRSAHDKLRKDVTDRLKALLAKAEQEGKASPTVAPSPFSSTAPVFSPAALALLPGPARPQQNDVDAINLIRSLINDTVQPGSEALIKLESWDEYLKLSPGSTARLLEAAASYPFSVHSKGNTTAILKRESELPF